MVRGGGGGEDADDASLVVRYCGEHTAERGEGAAAADAAGVAAGVEKKLVRGDGCELWYQDGWWEVKFLARERGKLSVLSEQYHITHW